MEEMENNPRSLCIPPSGSGTGQIPFQLRPSLVVFLTDQVNSSCVRSGVVWKPVPTLYTRALKIDFLTPPLTSGLALKSALPGGIWGTVDTIRRYWPPGAIPECSIVTALDSTLNSDALARGDQEHLGHDDDGYQSYCTICCHKAMGCCCCVAMQYHICQHPGDIRHNKHYFSELSRRGLDTPGHKLDTFRNNLDLAKESGNDEVIINNTYNPEEKSPRFTKNKLRDKASVAEKINNDVVSGEENKQPKSNKKKKKAVLQEQFNEEENVYETKLESFEKQITDFPKKKTKSKSQTDASRQKGNNKIKSTLNEVRDVTELEEEEQLIQAYQLQVAEDEANAIKEKIRKKLTEQMSEFTSSVQSQKVVLNNEVGKKKKKKKEVPVASEAETSAMSLAELQHNPVEDDTRKKKSSGRLLVSYFKDEMNTEEHKEEEDVEKLKPKIKKAKKKSKKALEENTEIAAENIQEMNSPEVCTQSKLAFDDSLVLGVYIHRTDRLKTDLMVSHPMVKIHVIDQKTGFSRAVSSFYEQERVEHILPIMTQPYDFRQFKSTLPEWEEQIIFNERFSYFLQDAEESPKVVLFFELVGANGVLNIDGKLRLQLYYPPPRTRTQSNVVEVFDWWEKGPRNRYPSTLYVTIKGIKLPDHVYPSFRSMMAVQKEQGSKSFCELQNEVSKNASVNSPHEKKEQLKWMRLPGQACRIPNKHLFSLRAGDMGCFCIRFSQDGKTLAAACAGRDGYPIILYEIPSGQYLREFYGHLNIVYDLCWSKDNEYLLTASSDGTVRMWKIETQATTSVRVFPHPSFVYTAKYHPVADYLVVTGCYDSVIREIKENDIKGTPINHLEVHPNGRRLLIHAKDSVLRIMDLRILATKKYIGATNYREKIHSTLTPCGTFLFSGSEDGIAYVWNPETGDQVAMYSDLSFTFPVRDVAFHPHEHMVSFCAFGQNQPILVYIYDYKVAQQEAEIVKDLNGSLASTTSRGPQILSNSSHISAQKDSTMSPANQFVSVARVSMRMQKVKQKLDSVMVRQIYLYFQENCKVLSYNAYVLYSTSTYYKTSVYCL
ncbi:Jouberin [Chelonia mydas]|uniref:Jouberin n=1 Tax=Chelonia mydas TaxID=8469 RepID=M7BHN7_CHEMY|nr:Jouberin [Chelonia mydas]